MRWNRIVGAGLGVLLVAGCGGPTGHFRGRSPEPGHGIPPSPRSDPYGGVEFRDPGLHRFSETMFHDRSTFAVDVDDASYAVCRKYLDDGHLPPVDAVRLEEFVNRFDYHYRAPGDAPFALYADAAPTPFGEGGTALLRFALQGREIDPSERRPATLTLVVDTSGSMGSGNRIALVRDSLHCLVARLRPDDRIGLVTFGTRARTVLPPTAVRDRRKILRAIDRLSPGGSTNAEAGLREGYAVAERVFDSCRINRVILCSDGVANVGRTGADEILDTVDRHREEGITLTTLGYGMGNYNDALLERLGDRGDGRYAYIDTQEDYRRLFEEALPRTLETLARDVKVQVEFDDRNVRAWRLLGYENRHLNDSDFRDDRIDGGEVGPGHSVTALYEIDLHPGARGRLAVFRLRYADPETREIRERSSVVGTERIVPTFANADPALRLAASAAFFAGILRADPWIATGHVDLGSVGAALDDLPASWRRSRDVRELAGLVARARSLRADRRSAETADVHRPSPGDRPDDRPRERTRDAGRGGYDPDRGIESDPTPAVLSRGRE